MFLFLLSFPLSLRLSVFPTPDGNVILFIYCYCELMEKSLLTERPEECNRFSKIVRCLRNVWCTRDVRTHVAR